MKPNDNVNRFMNQYEPEQIPSLKGRGTVSVGGRVDRSHVYYTAGFREGMEHQKEQQGRRLEIPIKIQDLDVFQKLLDVTQEMAAIVAESGDPRGLKALARLVDMSGGEIEFRDPKREQ